MDVKTLKFGEMYPLGNTDTARLQDKVLIGSHGQTVNGPEGSSSPTDVWFAQLAPSSSRSPRSADQADPSSSSRSTFRIRRGRVWRRTLRDKVSREVERVGIAVRPRKNERSSPQPWISSNAGPHPHQKARGRAGLRFFRVPCAVERPRFFYFDDLASRRLRPETLTASRRWSRPRRWRVRSGTRVASGTRESPSAALQHKGPVEGTSRASGSARRTVGLCQD